MKPDPEWSVYVEPLRFVRPGVWRGRWRYRDNSGWLVAERRAGGWRAGPEHQGVCGFGASKADAIADWEARVLAHPSVDAIVWLSEEKSA